MSASQFRLLLLRIRTASAWTIFPTPLHSKQSHPYNRTKAISYHEPLLLGLYKYATTHRNGRTSCKSETQRYDNTTSNWTIMSKKADNEEKFVFKYWDGRGLMEVPRMLMALNNKFPPRDYEDNRYTVGPASRDPTSRRATPRRITCSRQTTRCAQTDGQTVRRETKR